MGISGRIAKAFLQSKLTPLVTVASLAVGVLGKLMSSERANYLGEIAAKQQSHGQR